MIRYDSSEREANFGSELKNKKRKLQKKGFSLIFVWGQKRLEWIIGGGLKLFLFSDNNKAFGT